MTADSRRRLIGAALIVAALFVCLSQTSVAASADHYLLNATSGTVVLNNLRALQQTVNYQLDPGMSFEFNGIFQRLNVRMPNGQTFVYDDRRLQRLHGGTTPSRGFWVLDNNGLRLVSLDEYLSAYRRLQKRGS